MRGDWYVLIYVQSLGAQGTQRGRPTGGRGRVQMALGESSSEGGATVTFTGKFKWYNLLVDGGAERRTEENERQNCNRRLSGVQFSIICRSTRDLEW